MFAHRLRMLAAPSCMALVIREAGDTGSGGSVWYDVVRRKFCSTQTVTISDDYRAALVHYAAAGYMSAISTVTVSTHIVPH